MTEFIYSRVSTSDQETASQLLNLKKQFPTAEIYEEKISGMSQKPILKSLVDRLQPNDKLIVFSVDRLGRKMTEVVNLIEQLTSRGIIIQTPTMTLQYGDMMGKLFIHIISSFAEMERDMIKNRLRNGIHNAIKKGQKWGFAKNPKFALDVLENALAEIGAGEPVKSVAARSGISRRYLYRIMEKRRAANL